MSLAEAAADRRRSGRGRDLALFVAWLVVLGLCLHYGRSLAPYLEDRGGRGGLLLLGLGALAALGYGAWRIRALAPERRRAGFLAGLGSAAGLYLLERLQPLMIERLHLVLYGVLALLAFRLWGHWRRGLARTAWAGVVCVLVGTLDEVVQYFHPQRVGDPADVATNAAASLLVLVALHYLEGPGATGPAAGKTL